MVVLVDLEGEDDDELREGRDRLSDHASIITFHRLQSLKMRDGTSDLPSPPPPPPLPPSADVSADVLEAAREREELAESSTRNLNVDGFSAVLSCYPAVSSLAGHLDLNDLHSLARTCRQIRSILIQYRAQLLNLSLHCTNGPRPLLAGSLHSNDGDLVTAADQAVMSEALDLEFNFGDLNRRVLTGKIGQCARDLVGECRRCGTVVCRNCVVKPPSPRLLGDRHRRLCATCKEAPVWMHTEPITNRAVRYQWQSEQGRTTPSSSSSASLRTSSSLNGSSLSGTASNGRQTRTTAENSRAFTAAAFGRDPCSCATRGVYMCRPCGQSLRSADTTYRRVWTWRSRYSTHIGGLGTGMGEGEQGQKCGGGERCLDAIESEVEIDCLERPAPTAASTVSASSSSSSSSLVPYPNDLATSSPQPPQSPKSDHDLSLSAGYLRQEVEGIGGVVKKKVKKRVRIGATVWEFEDERSSGNYLSREVTGQQRSWCGWCNRVILPCKP